MYESFFGLRERPFDLLPNPRFLYLAARHREALSNLKYGLGGGRGVTLLIGEAGTGKTTLVQSVLAATDRDKIECVVLSNPTLTRLEFYEYLTAGFGLTAEAALSKTQFLFELQRHLEARHAAGKVSAILIDEAQSLPYELLEEVRLLSNTETATIKLLAVVLAGQPELTDRLNETRLRQLKQRISQRCDLRPLDIAETSAYIAGRLRIAGGEPAQIFTREAVLAIYEASRGIPRTVNVISENSLIGAFAAQVKPVSRAIVDEVCRDFDLQKPSAASAAVQAVHGNGNGNGAGKPAPAPPAVVAAAGKTQEADDMFGSVTRKKRFSFF
jgi:general secretion pathway protein A